jgi:hypothetical protein
MKRNIIEHLFNGAIGILKRSITSDRNISGFETIIIPVERKQFWDYFLYNKKFRDKR